MPSTATALWSGWWDFPVSGKAVWRALNLPNTRAETDEQILADYRQTNPYIGLRMAKELPSSRP